jgi:hypothetical protein
MTELGLSPHSAKSSIARLRSLLEWRVDPSRSAGRKLPTRLRQSTRAGIGLGTNATEGGLTVRRLDRS